MLITRRELLSSLVAVSATAALPNMSFAQERNADLRINADRLRESLEGLSVFGRPTGGTFADGVSRLAFTDADVAGRDYAMHLMRAAGMEPRIDPAGNIFGSRSGSDQNLKPILFGSHIDSVPSGGNFDGDLGSMSAIEVIHTLQEHDATTRHPLQMVIWPNEEGGFTGSGGATGVLEPGELAHVYSGVSTSDGIRKLGGDPSRLVEARFLPGAFRCYLELHIEQGGILYKANAPIGVVEGIVSIDEYDVEIRGFANRRRTRCADGGENWTDRDDLRPQRRRHQPFTKGIHPLAGLCEWGQCSLADDPAGGQRLSVSHSGNLAKTVG